VDGTVWAWGHNLFGELGDGTQTQQSLPVQVRTRRAVIGASPPLDGISAIAAGGNHSLALRADGGLWAWGWNPHGQLGDNTTVTRAVAVRVQAAQRFSAPLSGVIAIAAGEAHSLAIRADGRAVAWGFNAEGQLADGTTQERHAPVAMLYDKKSPQTFVTAIAGGGSSLAGSHSLLVFEHAQALAWGNNDHGQLGDGSHTSSAVPVAVETKVTGDFLRPKAIGAGDRHSLAVQSGGPQLFPPGGIVFAWGDNAAGQLDGAPSGGESTPVRAGTFEGAASLEGGGAHSLALLADGTVVAWGSNASGQLGDGPNVLSTGPLFVRDPIPPGDPFPGVIAVAAGTDFSLALRVDGTVWAWGANGAGQLGDGTTDVQPLPVQVRNAGGDGYLTGVKAIAAGGRHALALKADGTAWAWGDNQRGQVGDGSGSNQGFPVPVVDLPPDGDNPPWAIAVAAGGQHGLLLLANGHLRAWGANDRGQLGDDSTTDRPLPVRVHNTVAQDGDLDGVKAIAGGGEHTLALRAETGHVMAWGSNSDGQLGTSFINSSALPVFAQFSLQKVGAIAAGAHHGLGLRPGL
jgi:alpha-tubulin suppressor-like RCC1 family protein